MFLLLWQLFLLQQAQIPSTVELNTHKLILSIQSGILIEAGMADDSVPAKGKGVMAKLTC